MSDKSYKQILRSTGISGIAQGIQILLKIIATKFIAVLIGPAGIGIVGLLQSTVDLIGTVTSGGISQSAVRDIAVAVKKNDQYRISLTIKVLRNIIWFIGLLGTLLVVVLAVPLSKIAFGDETHAADFRIISIVILLTQLASGQTALMQGYRKIKLLAISPIVSSLIVILITIPLYKYYGIDAIIPSMIIMAAVNLICTIFFSRKIQISKIKVTIRETIRHGKYLGNLGLALMISGLFMLIVTYLLRIIVNDKLGIQHVGIFQAGWVISAIYLQLIFQAMGRDYYPRLSSVSDSTVEINKLVNEQLHIGVLIASPAIAFMLILSPYIIQLIYSSAFIEATPMFQWLVLGTLLKVFIWPIAYILPALRASRTYLMTEAIGTFGLFILSFSLMDLFGIEAIGIAYVTNYAIYCIVILLSIRSITRLKLDIYSRKLIGISALLIAIIFMIVYLQPAKLIFILINILLFLFVLTWSLIELNKLIPLKQIVKNKFKLLDRP